MQLLVVNYHYFKEIKPVSGIYPLTIKEFKEQLATLSHCYEFITLRKLIELLKNKDYPSGNYCLLTFDDGLKEQMVIYELLQSEKIGGAFFVPTDAIEFNIPLDVHKLQHIRTIIDDETIYNLLDNKYCLSKVSFDEDKLLNQYRYDNNLSRKIKYFMNFYLTGEEKRNAINHLSSRIIKDEKVFASNLYMNTNDLSALSNSGMLGTHGAGHVPLAKLDPESVLADIQRSIRYLKNITSNSIEAISYPFGGVSAVSDEVCEMCIKMGLKVGFTMFRGINNNSDLNNALMLKRIDTNDAPGGKSYTSEYVK